MANFLSNLVARTFEAAAVIQPRPVSRFEPLGAAGRPLLGEGFAFETAEHEPAPDDTLLGARPPLQSPAHHPAGPEPPSRLPVAHAGPATPRQGPEPAPVAFQARQLQQEDADDRPTPGAQQPTSWATIRPRQTASPPNQPDLERAGEPPTPAGTQVTVGHQRSKADEPSKSTLQPAAQPTVIERVVAAEHGRSASTGAEADGAPARRETGARRWPIVERITERVVSERPVSPAAPQPVADGRSEQPTAPQAPPSHSASVVVQPDVARYVEPAPPAFPGAKPAPAPEAERTINVSIGRVDVRAVASRKPQPRRQQPTPPVMSLDEYLRRRSDGDSG